MSKEVQLYSVILCTLMIINSGLLSAVLCIASIKNMTYLTYMQFENEKRNAERAFTPVFANDSIRDYGSGAGSPPEDDGESTTIGDKSITVVPITNTEVPNITEGLSGRKGPAQSTAKPMSMFISPKDNSLATTG